MRFDTVIFLLNTTIIQDEIGNELESIQKRQTFAQKNSTRQSEFYQAASAGLKPELTFVLWLQEYKDESKIEYNDKQYSIVRTFERPDGMIELSCEEKIGNG